MTALLNISAYKFAPLADLPALRTRLLTEGHACRLKGTVLLSVEGINLFVAGEPDDVRRFLAEVRSVARLEDLTAKESFSATVPFGRLRVKLKREIIAFGVEGIDPARQPAPRLAPETLKAWLDAGRPVTLLDTRNTYEVERGSFRGAIGVGIRCFREFPSAVSALPPGVRQQPIVTFCTGGIRCEKAAPFLQRAGFTEVYQLDGGILKYFERCGSAHFEGDCFVFDERGALDDELRPTASPASEATA